MDYILTNLISILVATGVGLAVSILYHELTRRPGFHGRVGPTGLLMIAAIAEFWLASILAGALILAPQQADPWVMALGSAVVIWIGFVLPTLIVTEAFRGVPLSRTTMDCSIWLVVMIIQAAALHAMGLIKPHP